MFGLLLLPGVLAGVLISKIPNFLIQNLFSLTVLLHDLLYD